MGSQHVTWRSILALAGTPLWRLTISCSPKAMSKHSPVPGRVLRRCWHFPAGTAVHSIAVRAAGYQLTGNAVALSAGLSVDVASDLASDTVIGLPLTANAPEGTLVDVFGTPRKLIRSPQPDTIGTLT